MDNLLNVNQVAFMLKVHPLTVRRYINEGRLKAIKVAGNVRIKESDLLEFNSKDISPKESADKTHREKPVKTFSADDPFLRLKGRGASLHLTEQ